MKTQVISYETNESSDKLNVYYHDDTFWLTLENISRLFGSDTKSVYKTLKDVLRSGSLNDMKVNQHIEVTSQNGKKYPANFYNIDIIMAIGYRLNAFETTKFRLWSMYMVKNYLLQGAKMEYGMIGSLKRKFSYLLQSA